MCMPICVASAIPATYIRAMQCSKRCTLRMRPTFLEGLLLPVPFGSAQEIRQFGWTYRVAQEQGHWVLQSLHANSWTDLYAFSLEPQELIDYEMANYYSSTYPDSRFVQTLTAQLPNPQTRTALRNRELIVDDGKTITSRTLAGDIELLEVLAEVFGLRFAHGTRFRIRTEPGGDS